MESICVNACTSTFFLLTKATYHLSEMVGRAVQFVTECSLFFPMLAVQTGQLVIRMHHFDGHKGKGLQKGAYCLRTDRSSDQL